MIDKHFSFQKAQQDLTHHWDHAGTFNYTTEDLKEPFTVIMPPPNVTGSLHMGHALTFTLQDILIRFHRKLGHHVLWQPGADHAGIATQTVVENNLAKKGLKRLQMGRASFLDRVWQWKNESGDAINHQLRQLGASAPWHRHVFTMDEPVNQAVNQVFVKLFQDGLLYKSKRLVNWDVVLQTAISDIEVTHKTAQDPFYFIKYPLYNAPSEHIIIATTRPETLFADVAIAVHPEDERYQNWIGQSVLLPLTEKKIPIIADEWCKKDVGTGAVKITPGHDFNDYEVGLRHSLTLIEVINHQGQMIAPAHPNIIGLDRTAARSKVASMLENQGYLDHIETITHSVPYAERSESIIEPRLMDQWYIDAAKLAQAAIEAVELGHTQFVPEYWSATYFEWMRNIQPWCISRQIWWGHRIPAWYGPDGKVFVAHDEPEAMKQAQDFYHKPVSLTQDLDVLDTWFSSALWPFVTLGWPKVTPELQKHYPSDVLVTGHDIIFFWVARMMMMGLYIMKEVPFKKVYIHALVKDEKGQKMSKSKGNVVNPLELMETYGADALRLTLALQAAPGRDIKFSPSRIEGAKHFISKLWNAARYCLMNQCHYDPHFDQKHIQHKANRWIINQVNCLMSKMRESLEDYAFHQMTLDLYQGFWGDFCDWYLELTKPTLQEESASFQQETRQTTGWVLSQFLHMLHPIIPFVTEEVWKHLLSASGRPHQELSLAPFCLPHQEKVHQPMQNIEWVKGLIEEIRSCIKMLGLESAEPECLYTSCDPEELTWVEEFSAPIKRLAKLSNLTSTAEADAHLQAGFIVTPFGKGYILIQIKNVLNENKEIARLQKDLIRLEAEKTSLNNKLENADFLSKAPLDVVEEIKERFNHTSATIAKLEGIIARLIEAS